MLKRLFAGLLLFGALLLAPASAHEIRSGDLLIQNLWSRATSPEAKVGVAYMVITNNGTATEKLLGGSSPLAARVELHESKMTDGIMTMRPVEGGLAIEPGQSVTLSPRGFHLMLVDLKSPLQAKQMLPITLDFERAGRVEATFHILSVGAHPWEDTMPGHGDHKM
jgi:periplasmic copper chaperone A